jgi:hypothetical protein
MLRSGDVVPERDPSSEFARPTGACSGDRIVTDARP